MAQSGRNPPARQETTSKAGDPGLIPGWDPLEKTIATHSGILPGKSHGQRSLMGYSPWGHKRVGHDLVTKKQQQSHYNGFPLWFPRDVVTNYPKL